jgi:hypothetical protein
LNLFECRFFIVSVLFVCSVVKKFKVNL